MPGAPLVLHTPITEADAYGWKAGMEAARLFAALFPDDYTAHVRQRPATPVQLAHVAQGFLTLVHERLFPSQETTIELDRCANLELALTWLPDSARAQPLACLNEISQYIAQPSPLFYGLELQECFDNGEPDMMSALTVAIWHLFAGTSLTLNAELEDFLDHLAPAAQAAIKRLVPIPPWTPIDPLLGAVVIRKRPWSRLLHELLPYAFNMCDNPLARISYYELDVVYGASHEFTWDDADDLKGWAEEAEAMADAYRAWEKAVDRDPEREIRALSRAVHRAARPLAAAHRPPDEPRTLAEQFAHADEDPDDDD